MVIMLWFACTTVLSASHLTDYRSIMASFSRDGDCDSPNPKRKFSGSATYNCKYDHLWKMSYPCIEEVKNDNPAFYCLRNCHANIWALVILKGTFKEQVTRRHLKVWRCKKTTNF